jgi:hypothetical protein
MYKLFFKEPNPTTTTTTTKEPDSGIGGGAPGGDPRDRERTKGGYEKVIKQV